MGQDYKEVLLHSVGGGGNIERFCQNPQCGAHIVVEGKNVKIEKNMLNPLCDECKKWLKEVLG